MRQKDGTHIIETPDGNLVIPKEHQYVVYMSWAEAATCHLTGKRRDQQNKKAGNKNQIYGDPDAIAMPGMNEGLRINISGVRGEVAAATILNCMPDLITDIQDRHGNDFFLHTGERAQVKTVKAQRPDNPYPNNDLMVDVGKENDSEIFILVEDYWPATKNINRQTAPCDVRGWIRREDLVKYPVTVSTGKKYRVPVGKLLRFEDHWPNPVRFHFREIRG